MSSAGPTKISRELLAKYALAGPRYTTYPLPEAWDSSFGPEQYAQALRAAGAREADAVSIYVHLPFCATRCLYCGRNTTTGGSNEEVESYLDALEQEMALVASLLGGDREVLQLHLGGGTPNFLNESQLARLVATIERTFKVLPETESSIKCDPRLVSNGQLALLRGLGFSRINISVPDLLIDVQQAVGRLQSPALVEDVYWMARDCGFDKVSLDLLYGLPQQTEQGFAATLESLLELGPDRACLHSYSHLPALRPHQWGIDVEQLPSAVDKVALFQVAARSLMEAGYEWIGLDHFVVPGDELAIAQQQRELQLNAMGYTAMPDSHLLAFGTSSMGEVDGVYIQNDTQLASWHSTLGTSRLPIVRGHRLNSEDHRRRQAIAHLICHRELPSALCSGGIDAEYRRLSRYARDGLIERGSDRIVVTELGRFFVRNLCLEQDGYSDASSAAQPRSLVAG